MHKWFSEKLLLSIIYCDSLSPGECQCVLSPHTTGSSYGRVSYIDLVRASFQFMPDLVRHNPEHVHSVLAAFPPTMQHDRHSACGRPLAWICRGSPLSQISKTGNFLLASLISPKVIRWALAFCELWKTFRRPWLGLLNPLLYPTMLCNILDSANHRVDVLRILTKQNDLNIRQSLVFASNRET